MYLILQLQPSFPVDEKRRILEVFKERKKSRRKKGAKTATISTGIDAGATATTIANGNHTSANSSVCSGGSSKENAMAPTTSWKVDAAVNSGSNNFNGNAVPNGEHSNTKQTHPPVEANGRGVDDLKKSDDLLIEDLASSSTSKRKKKKKKIKRQLSVDSVTESRSSSPSKGQELGSKSSENDVSAVETTPKEKSKEEQNHLQQKEQSKNNLSLPPPGFDKSISSLALNDNVSQIKSNRQVSASSSHQSLPDGDGALEQQTTKQQHQSLPPGSRCIVIPEQDRPMLPPIQIGDPPGLSSQTPPKTSLAVAAAKVFVDLYYQHITLGLASGLAMYYTPHAQKSISVGGAHSVVATRYDIMLQLQSLARSVFVVRGVVSQDSFDRRGAHILVTGVVQTNGVMTQFAQTISLVPIPQHGQYSFQIHNDALSLLTNGDDVA